MTKRVRRYWMASASCAICVAAILVSLKDMTAQTDLVPYVPVVRRVDRGDHLLVNAPELLTDAHVKAMISVLTGYGERYEAHGPALRIEQKLAEDRDLLANYTEKAQASLVP